MKTIENKLSELEVTQGTKSTYAQICCMVVKSTPQAISISDMRDRLRLIDILEKSDKTIDLEDADYKALMRLLNEFKWPTVHKGIVQLMDDMA